MRIKIVIISLLFFLMFITGCSGKQLAPLPSEPATVALVEKEPANAIAVETPANTTEPDRQPYMEQYGAQHCFVDVFFPEKCWLICEETIVQLISFEGFDDVTVIDRASVERVQSLSLGDCVSVEIFDRTNQTISIMVSLPDAEPLLELLS